MAHADIDEWNRLIRITTDYAELDQIRQLPGARFDKDAKQWTAPLSWATCIVLRGLFGDALMLSESLNAWAWLEYRERVSKALRLRDLLQDDEPFPILDEIEGGQRLKLYPYQRVDVRFLATAGRALLANPPGLGKSAVVIRTLQVLERMREQPFPALVVCPNTLKFTTWAKEFKQWAPEITVQVVDGSANKRRKQFAEKPDVWVINWEGMRMHSRIAPYGTIALTDKDKAPKELNGLGLRAVVFDESHRLKDPTAQVTRAAWAVASDAQFRFALTGTPVVNNIGDIWSIGHTIDPASFSRRTKFLDRFAETRLNHFGGHEILGIDPRHRDELFKFLDPIVRRVPKNAALPQLPPKLPVQYRHTPMGAKQAKAYKEMEETMIARLNEILVAPSPLAALTRLFQFASASAQIDDVGRVRLSVPSPKVDDMVDLLEEMGDESLVVAAVSRQLIELAAERLTKLKIKHSLITGGQGSAVRARAVDDFQEGRTRVMLLTIDAGAEGITLTRADTLLFMQRHFSEVKNQQCEDRIHRIGSERHACVRIIDQITPGTVEERKLKLLEKKRGRMEEIVRDQETLLKLLGAA